MKTIDVNRILTEWFKKKKIKPRCPLCKHYEFKYGIITRLTNRFSSRSYVGVIPVIGTNCAYTFFVSDEGL